MLLFNLSTTYMTSKTSCIQEAFTYADVLRHVEARHELERATCPVCRCSFSSPYLARHLARVHGGRVRGRLLLRVCSCTR